MHEMKETLSECIRTLRGPLEEIAHAIHDFAEIGFTEHKSSEYLRNHLENHGFEVEVPRGLDTAFVARLPGPPESGSVGYVAEYDALPDLGHACGHNLIAAAAVGAALTLKGAGLNEVGSVFVFGTPAEEGGGGKVLMADRGYFNSCDCVFYFHPGHMAELYGKTLALASGEITHTGVPSHAQVSPEAGRDALKAMMMTFSMLDANGYSFPNSTRIGRIIKEGGSNPFIVPERCIGEVILSCDSLSDVNRLKQTMQNCVQGAALAFGTSGVCMEKMRYKNTIPNSTLNGVVAEALSTVGVPFSKERLAMVSSDIGDASQVTALGGFRLPVLKQTPPYHTRAFAECCKLPEAIKMVQEAVLVLSLCGWKVVSNAEVRDKARQEFNRASEK